jgi:hypothetical protein
LLRITAIIWAAVFLLLLFILTGCNSITSLFLIKPKPEGLTIEDTKFDEDKIDWIEVYNNEIRIAMENEDEEAYHFFMHQLLTEKIKRWKEKQKNEEK